MMQTLIGYSKSMLEFLLPASFILSGKSCSEKKIALTFDDGPHKDHTESILNVLKKGGIKATFFVLGKKAKRYPDLVKMMVYDGHEIANHSYSHLRDADIKDIEKGKRIIEEVSGTPAKLFRPPWGRITLSRLGYALSRRVKIVLWSFDSCDFRIETSDGLRNYIKQSDIRAGDILLFHEDYVHTKEALGDIIADLKSRGFGFDTVSGLLRR